MLVTRRRFEELVGEALDTLPESIAGQMENVAVLVEDWPSEAQLAGRPGTLLGLYEGVMQTDRSPLAYTGVMPDRITVFRGPLCQIARGEHDLAEQIRVTVLHEIGHHFGLDDDRLHELGWG